MCSFCASDRQTTQHRFMLCGFPLDVFSTMLLVLLSVKWDDLDNLWDFYRQNVLKRQGFAVRKIGMFFKIERCEMPAIRTPAAVWPAMRAPAMPNR